MFGNIMNGTVVLSNGTMDYVRFGSGKTDLVLLPGLGDGLKTVRGTALPMALLYREFAKEHTVYMFSRKNALPDGYTTRDMARDQKEAMEILGIRNANVVGVSMGGMIAEWLAVDAPACVNKLALVVTCADATAELKDCVNDWISMVQRGDHFALMDSNVRRIYSEAYYRKNKWLIPITAKLTKPRSYARFLIQANACLTHDARAELAGITMPVWIIGGEQDRVLGCAGSRELAEQIPAAELLLYPQWGHGLYDEAKDFQKVLLDFFRG